MATGRNRALVCALLAVLLAACPSLAAELQELSSLQCYGGTNVELHIKQATVNVEGIVTFTTRLYHVDGTAYMPAPIIKMKAGEYCSVNIVNDLPATAGQSSCPYHSNSFHCADTTVLHTHGLHVSPYEDNIDTHVNPQASLKYEYNLPENHLMGTHWYHAHKHGSTFLQVMGGMVGPLLVEPTDAYLASMDADMKALYTSATHSHVMMMVHHFFGPSDAGGGGFSMDNYEDISNLYGSAQSVDPAITVHDSSNADFYTINGQWKPTITMVTGDTHVLRMIHGGGVRVLRVVQGTGTSASCTFTLLARDGVFHETPYQTVSTLVFAQGTRADYAVKCDLTGGATTDQVVNFAATPSTDTNYPISTQNQQTQATLFTITVTPAPGGHVPLNVPTAAVARPTYLNDLQSTTPEAVTTISLGGGAVNGNAFGGFDAPVASRYVGEMCLNKVYEVSLNPPAGGGGPPNRRLGISNNPDAVDKLADPHAARQLMGATSAHPYHQHINHFQIVDFNGQTGFDPDLVRLGEWRDVVFSHDINVRFPTDSFVGEVVMHCHILEHEDLGMMALWLIEECCSTASDCTAEAAECKTAACTSGACVYTSAADGTSCTGGTCSSGVCVGCSSNTDCDDSNDCTTDTCSGGTCSNANAASGSACGSGDVCDGSGTCVDCLSASDCDDSKACTTDTCSGNTCAHSNVGSGTSCGGSNQCDGAGECVACLSASDCDDSKACTTDTCSAGTCSNVNTASGTSCGGSNQCDGSGECVACLSASDCDDSNACTTDTCSGGTCSNVNKSSGSACGSGDVCDGSGTCVDCLVNADCDDSNACTVNTCSGNTCGSTNQAAGTDCGGGNVCSNVGTCLDCASVADCDDSNECTTDACESGSCTHTSKSSGTSCGSGEYCNGSGSCVACTTASHCDDSNDCTTDTCSGNVCANANKASGTTCGSADVCNGSGTCVDCLGASDCDDSNECTTDTCSGNVCANTNKASGTTCGSGDYCDAGGSCVACITGAHCDDSNDCTTDTCSAGSCSNPNKSSGSACGSGDVCNGSGTCVGCVSNSDCDDGNGCTTDTCNAGSCSSSSKSDGTSCSGGTCQSGTCDAAPTVTTVVLVQTGPTRATVTGSVNEAATVYCTVRGSVASVTLGSVLRAALTSSTLNAAGSFSISVTGLSGAGARVADCLAVDLKTQSSAVASSASVVFDTTAPVVTLVSAASTTTVTNGIRVTGSINEAGKVFCAGYLSSATTPTSANVVSVGTSVQVAGAGGGSFTSVFSSSVTGSVRAICVGMDSVGNIGANPSLAAAITVSASSAATATCSDGILNGDESDTDCGHSNNGCSLCPSGRACASTSNCEGDTVCATNSGSNLCTEIGITAAGEYVLFEAVLHGSLSAEDFVGDLRQAYLLAVAAQLGVAVSDLFVTEVTTTNSINVKTEVKVGGSGKTSTELESSVGTMLATSSGTSPLREALIESDPAMEYKVTSTQSVSVSSETRTASSLTEPSPTQEPASTNYNFLIIIGGGLVLIFFGYLAWYCVCRRNKRSKREHQAEVAKRSSRDMRAGPGVGPAVGGNGETFMYTHPAHAQAGQPGPLQVRPQPQQGYPQQAYPQPYPPGQQQQQRVAQPPYATAPPQGQYPPANSYGKH